MTWTLEFIDSSEQESYRIVGSNMTDEILESTKHTSERYGMIYTFQAEETVRIIDEYLCRVDVKEMFKQKLVHSFEIALERIIPDILINGYMNHRFRITDSSMSKKEDKIFQKETDHYRDVRNEWEFKRLYRDVARLLSSKCLAFLPEKKLIEEMGYSDLEDVLKDLNDSKLFKSKNQNLQKFLKYKLKLEIRDDKVYLLSQSI